jgi:hypothetical protein
MGKKRVLISYGVDVDAVSGWLGSYGGEDSTSDISRGIFAGTVGTQRLLKMFKKVREAECANEQHLIKDSTTSKQLGSSQGTVWSRFPKTWQPYAMLVTRSDCTGIATRTQWT